MTKYATSIYNVGFLLASERASMERTAESKKALPRSSSDSSTSKSMNQKLIGSRKNMMDSASHTVFLFSKRGSNMDFPALAYQSPIFLVADAKLATP